jgi:hypothetical protein
MMILHLTNQFDEILDEICEKTGYASDESEDEMW